MKAHLAPVENSADALSFVLDSLSVCAHDHTLSARLLTAFRSASGPIAAIAPPWIDLGRLQDFSQGSRGPAQPAAYDAGFNPRSVLVAFVQSYLRQSGNPIVVCENWGWKPEHVRGQPWPPPRIAYFGEEVLHVLTPDITDPDQVEAAVVARHHWQTGLCSACTRAPEGKALHESFFDEVVQKTTHIFVPALDGGGYLIWSPVGEPDSRPG